MSVEVLDAAEGVFTVKIAGTLTQSELASIQKQMSNMIGQSGGVRILAITTDFTGWDRESDWSDMSFQLEHDKNIARMAIVGDKKWEDLALLFTAKGMRPFPIEYFPSEERSKAEAWVRA